MCRSKNTLGGPINYRALNSSTQIAQLKRTLMHKCTSFSVSKLVHRFLMSTLSGCTRYHNALPNKINSDRTSYYIEGLVHSVSDENLNVYQVKGWGAQIHTIYYYFAETNHVLIPWWGVHANLLLC